MNLQVTHAYTTGQAVASYAMFFQEDFLEKRDTNPKGVANSYIDVSVVLGKVVF
jgi:hypothetical protein